MSSELSLVTEMAIILIAAGLFTIISKALKQPLILGYIVAGFVVGPHLGLFPQFSPESVDVWSELGIIFLLFGLGLEFNFKKLLNVGSAAFISAITICIGMFCVGFITGTALGWGMMESIFLGGMLSMSSTTIIIKAYDDLGIKNEPYASLVFGLLVVEDLLAVLMMVLFSTLAVSNQFSGMDMLLSLTKLVIFLVLCFLVGIYVIPSIFRRAKDYISDEILLLISVGLCFLMVILANKAGFSSALGAFLMGSVLSSTIEGERIEHLTVPIKNLFGAIFFVSVGMMVDPSVIAGYWPVILVITLVAMAGILVFSTTGVLFAGKSLDTALHVGFSLPQLGEFSFIIAGLGCSLGVLRDFIYPVIISVSVITTFTTPYMIKAATPVSTWLHRVLPERLLDRINRRAEVSSSVNRAEGSVWKTFARKYFIRVALYSMVLLVLLVGMKEFLPQITSKLFPDMGQGWLSAIRVAIALVVMSPFLYGLAASGQDLRKLSSTLYMKDQRNRIPVILSIFIRLFLAVQFAAWAIWCFAKISKWFIVLVYVVLILSVILVRRRSSGLSRIESRFLENLNAKDELSRRQAPVTAAVKDKMDGYDVHIEKFKVPQDFLYIGKTLREMPFRKTSGVNIVKIQRGNRSILIPGGDERIFPGDDLVAVGTTGQIDAFKKIMTDSIMEPQDDSREDFSVETVVLDAISPLTGKTLQETDMRASGCMVISVERNGLLHTNPSKDFKFAEGDMVWLAGLKSSLDWYLK